MQTVYKGVVVVVVMMVVVVVVVVFRGTIRWSTPLNLLVKCRSQRSSSMQISLTWHAFPFLQSVPRMYSFCKSKKG